MSRTPRKRQWTDEACYHVLNRGHDRGRIFVDDDDRGHFLGLLARHQGRFGIRLEAGMVSEPWQYAWSSCRAYASGVADASLAGNPYDREWGNDDGSRQRRWRELLLREDPEETSIRRADWAVGDEPFRAQLEGYQGRAERHRRGRPPDSGRPTAGISS